MGEVFRTNGNWREREGHGAGRSPPPTGDRSRPVAAGCGHPALREQCWWCTATGQCGHRPLRRDGEVSATTRASGAQRSVCGADGRNGWELEQRSSPKRPATSDNPSVSLRLTAPFAQGSLALRGTGGHIGPPLREVGRCSGTNGNLVQDESLVRRGWGSVPARFSRGAGYFNRICRDRPMCRPGRGSLRDLSTGGHTGPPLREVGGIPEQRELV